MARAGAVSAAACQVAAAADGSVVVGMEAAVGCVADAAMAVAVAVATVGAREIRGMAAPGYGGGGWDESGGAHGEAGAGGGVCGGIRWG